MARQPKVYDESELLRLHIVDQARANGSTVITVRDAACFLLLHIYSGPLIGWEREVLAVAVAEVVSQKLGDTDDTTLGEALWMMLREAARREHRYYKTAEQSLVKAGEYIENGEVSRWARLVIDHIS